MKLLPLFLSILALAGCSTITPQNTIVPIDGRVQDRTGQVVIVTGWTLGGGLVPGSFSFQRQVTKYTYPRSSPVAKKTK